MDKLYQLNSFLKRLAVGVDWEAFRPALSILRKPQPDGMTKFFIRDRKTFHDFLGITPYQTIPDAKTILAS